MSATRIGIPSDFAFYFVAIGNASSLFGRFAAGRLSDIIGAFPPLSTQALVFPSLILTLPVKLAFIGPMNVIIPFTACAAILTYCWPFAETKTTLIVVTVIYG